MSDSLNKKFTNAQGDVSVDGTRLGYRFVTVPNSVVIAAEGFITVEEAKSGKAKQELIKDTNNFIRSQQRLIENRREEIAKEQAVLNDPNESSIAKKGAERRIAEQQAEIAQDENQIAGAQSVLAYANSGFQADLDSLVSKAEAEQKKLEEAVKQQEAPAPKPEATTSGEGQPAETTSETAENSVDDDATAPASAAENQNPDVSPTPGQTTTAANAGGAPGVSASPGSAPSTGKSIAPGRRLYNPLSQLASYTYSISLYMVTPEAYDNFVANGRRKLETNPGVLLIAQSGGINNNTQNRAPGFDLDFYLDNLKFDVTTSMKASGTDAYYTEISFQITEPYGFSFIQNLRTALDALKEHSAQTSYKECVNNLNQFFILGLRFYGYDINGNVVKGTDELYGKQIDPLSNGSALFEHFYDIKITEMKFNLNGKTVVYNISAAGINGQSILGVKRSRIPEGVALEGKSVHDALTGPNGLFTQLNKREQEKVNKNPPDQEHANSFEVVYLGDAYERIGMASIVTPSDLDKTRWPGAPVQTTSQSTDAAGKAPPTSDKRQIAFNNDSSIIQVIQQVVKQSEYMENALKTLYNNTKQPDPKGKSPEQITNNIPTKLSWFTVSAELREPKWDTKINDWAFKTVYIIQVYEVPAMESPYSKAGAKYYGPHKRYDYWFTGKNSEVLDFSVQFDQLYHNVGIGLGAGQDATNPSGSAGGLGLIPVKVGVRQDGDRTGRINAGAEAQNSVTTYLYDPDAWARARLKILGDPDFLVSDGGTSLNELYNQFYGADGYTVSALGGPVFIEVDFKEAVDYKNSTGLMNINESISMQKYPPSVAKIVKGVVFGIVTVTSTFNNGKFEQTFLMNLPTFADDPADAPAAVSDTREGQSVQSTGSTTSSGASPSSTKSTSGSTGQKQDPPPLTKTLASPAVSAPTTQTTGTSSPQTIPTQTGAVADDDALQPVIITSQRRTTTPIVDQGREPEDLASKTDAELFALGYMPDEIDNIRRGRGP